MNTMSPTTLTRKYIIIERPSTTQPSSNTRLLPIRPTSKVVLARTPWVMFWTNSTVAHTLLMARAPIASSAPWFFILLPKARMRRKATNGSTSMIPAVSAQKPPVIPASTAWSASVARMESERPIATTASD